ncbi:MAG: ABC transporter substrate-binding protein, partial [Bdellovibrionota bacterium]
MHFLSLILLVSFWLLPLQAEEPSFRFHILSDPVTLDPLRSNGSWNSFIHYNLYRSFFHYDGTKLVNENAKKCSYITLRELHCQMNMNRKYSNGQKITLRDYIQPFRSAFDKDTTAKAKAELLLLKNAKAILDGKKKKSDLGVSPHPQKKDVIVFTFDRPDADFLSRLSSPVFAPRPAEEVTSDVLARDYASGPYKFQKKENLKYVQLASNQYYEKGHATRPIVKALIVNNDSTAFNMYRTGVLNFLRRLPQDQYNVALKSEDLEKEIYVQPQLRMDHLGFAGILIDQPHLREALALSANYPELQRILQARGQPGCFSLLKHYYSGEAICYQFDLKKAKELLKIVSPEILKKPIQLYYSIQGGEDIQRAIEWFQNQWKKNLNLNIHLNPSENTELTNRLKTQPPDIYRRGVPVDSASCLSALE